MIRLVICFLALSSSFIGAETLSVKVVGLTPQQAVLSIETDGSACTIQISERADFSTVVPDVDPSLFQDSDACNRLGSVVNRNTITFVAGARTTATALNGDIVSRSLQADTLHYYRVKLASGATASGNFTTIDPPLGNSAPDAIPFNKDGYGNYGWPTLHFDKNADVFIDPQTGLQIQRLTGINDEVWMHNEGMSLIPEDLSGGGWSMGCQDPSNGQTYTSQNGTNACTYSGPGGRSNALFLRPTWWGDDSYSANFGGTRFSVSDARLNIAGSGPANLQSCITYDHQNCIGGPPYDQITMPATMGNVTSAPNYPRSAFSEYGKHVEVRDDQSRQPLDGGSISISGNVLTATGSTTFPVTILKPGMLLEIYEGNWSNWNRYTIASIQDSRHVTLTQPVTQSYSNPQYQLVNFGFLVWKDPASSGAVSLDAISFDTTSSKFANVGVQGSDGNTQCGTPFDLQWDAQGNPYPDGPKQAYFCSLQFASSPNLMKIWIPSTGETRKISVMDNVSFGDGLDAQGYLQSCSYNINDATYGHYKAYDDGGSGKPNPAIGCTRYPLAKSVDQLIRAAYPQVDWSYWGRPIFHGGPDKYDFITYQTSQNQPYIGCILDPTNTASPVSYCVLPNDPGPNRWSTSHSGGGGFLTSYGQTYINWYMHFWSNTHDPSAGIWTIDLSSIAGNTSARGATALDASFAQSCAAIGVTNPEWIALESSDKSCFQATVPHEPVDKAPSTGDFNTGVGDYPQGPLTPLANPAQLGSRPSPWVHNSKACGGDGTTSNCWSYFHDYVEGDWAVDPANTNEAFLIAKVNGNQVVFMRCPNYLIGPSTKHPFGSRIDHANGFTLQMVPYAVLAGGNEAGVTYSLASKKPTDWSDYLKDNPDVYGGHIDSWTTTSGADVFLDDFGYWLPDQVGGVGYGVRYGIFPHGLSDGFQFGIAAFHPFQGSGAGLGIYQQQVQSHSGGYTWSAPLRETQWAMDWQPYGGAAGGSANLWPTVTSLVSGQSHTYKVSPPAIGCGLSNTPPPGPSCQGDSSGALWYSTPDPKRRTTYSGAGPYILKNISGPGSKISDDTPFTRCHALLAGECVAGSQPGDEYQSVPSANLYSGYSQINASDLTPFMNAAGPELAWGFQYGIDHPDPFGLNWRHLTMGFAGPTKESNYANIHGNADGRWGIFTDYLGDGVRGDVFAIKLPPWPNTDSISRNTFIPVQVTFVPTTDVQARVRFGYGENAGDTKDPYYCSAERNEECSTVTGGSEPFAWLSETNLPMWQSCAANKPCTITINALSGRTLEYAIDRSSNGQVTISSTQVVAVK